MVERSMGSPPSDPDGHRPIHVLHVDDHPDLLEVTALALEQEMDQLTVHTATSGTEGLEILETEPIDCIVSDYDMPEMNGLAFLDAVRETGSSIPFILYTGQGSEEIASEAISAGVTDYLQKGTGTEQYTVLANRIENAVAQYRSRQEVVEMQRWFQTLIEHSTDIITVLDATKTIQYMSPALTRILGYESIDALIGSSGLDWVHPADSDRVESTFETIIEDDKKDTVSVELRLMDASGEWHWFDAVISDRTDTVVDGYVLTAREITDRKEREWELKRYEAIVEAIDDAIYVLDSDGNLKYVNDSYAELKGVPRAKLIGSHISNWVSEDTLDTTADLEEQLLEGEIDVAQLTYDFETVTGETFPAVLRFVPVSLPDGEVGSLGIIRDISEREQQRRQLQQERDRFSALFENFPEPTIGYEYRDGEPHICTVNTAFEETFGHDAEAVIGEEIGELIVPPEKKQEAARISERVQAGEAIDRKLCRQAADGNKEFRFRNIETPNDDKFDGFAVYADITERTEKQRELQQKNERLEQFASAVSHDLKSPLNVALGRLEFAHAQQTQTQTQTKTKTKTKAKAKQTEQEQTQPQEQNSDDLATAIDALERMTTLIDDLTALARQGEVIESLTSVNLAQLAEDSWSNVETKEATLVVETALTVEADPSRLKQAFENLFRNAIEHGRGSTTDLSQSDEANVTVTVGTLADGNGFYVEDDGPGIPADQRERVFEAGYTSTESGTGFGLRIVADIIEAHGWTIDVTDADGHDGGARFEITGVQNNTT